MRSAPTLVCELARSRAELLAIGVLTTAALAAPWLAALAAGWRAALVAGAVAAGAFALREWRRRPWTALALAGDGTAVLRAQGLPEWRGTLTQATVLGPLVVLALKDAGGASLRLPIYPDSTDADTRRRLRVLLRHGWRAEPGDAIR